MLELGDKLIEVMMLVFILNALKMSKYGEHQNRCTKKSQSLLTFCSQLAGKVIKPIMVTFQTALLPIGRKT